MTRPTTSMAKGLPKRRAVSGCAVDVFCGAGGLTYGLRLGGLLVAAGIDLDPACKYPLEYNNPGTKFILADVATMPVDDVDELFHKGVPRILVGCAPCQPFSPYTHGLEHDRDPKWSLVDRFGDLVTGLRPDVLSMENTLELRNYAVFQRLLRRLRRAGYFVTTHNVNCADYGVPQARRRLVLLGSRTGYVDLVPPQGNLRTVRETIAHLPSLRAGEACKADPLHRAASLSPINLRRIRAARPGGTWRDWECHLRSPCHRKTTGRSFRSVYGRMEWDRVGPTVTTQSFKFGTGRFGHPDQDRAISLREAALLQTFPDSYRIVPPGEPVHFSTAGRLIGNAVPVALGRVIADSIVNHLEGAL